jgi:hypothetical protein
VFRLTRGHIIALPVRGYHPLRPCFPDRFRLSLMCHWPGPRSLATTNGVSVDVLSSRYLDVSVPWVCLKPPILFGSLIPSLDNRKSKTSTLARLSTLHVQVWLQTSLLEHQNIASLDTRSWSSGYRRWVSPFGNPWIKASSQLPTAYRSVARPSSPLSAKASTEHP